MHMSRLLFRSIFVAGVSIAALACNDPNPQSPLHEEDIQILTEVMMIEAVLHDFSGAKKDSLVGENYGVLYDRYGISESELQALRTRFSNEPTLWSQARRS